MKKVKLSIIVLLVIVSSYTVVVMGSEIGSTTINLEETIAIALEENLDLKKASLTLEKANLEYQQNKANNLMQRSRYSELQFEYQLELAKSNYKNAKYNVANNTIEQYTSLWLSELDLQIKEKRVQVQEKMLLEAKAQYSINDISAVDLLERENSYNDAKFILTSASDEYQKNMRIFSSSLGFVEKPILMKLDQPNIRLLTEKEVLDTALKNSVNIQLKTEEVELARLNLERANVASPELEKKIKELLLQIAEIEEEKTIEEITASTQAAYYQFAQAIKNLELKEERLNGAREKYQLYKKQYEVGLIKETDILEYEINMMVADLEFRSAISSYYLREQALRQAMNLEVEVNK